MFSTRQTQSTDARQHNEGAFQRVSVNLTGRLMVSSHDEFTCTAVDMSPGDAVMTCNARPRTGERIIAYMDHVGRIEGTVSRLADNAFVMSINTTERKREKLAAQLTWIANKHELGLPEDRRHDRLAPRKTRTEILLGDGERHTAKIIDMSLSGCAVDTDIRPPLGTAVMLGTMRARVVRHFQEGVALEFFGLQTIETLREFL